MPLLMNKRQAWDKLAALFDKPKKFDLKNYHQTTCVFPSDKEDEPVFGLCQCPVRLYQAKHITETTCKLMTEQLSDYLYARGWSKAYLFPLNDTGAKKRAEVCRELALE